MVALLLPTILILTVWSPPQHRSGPGGLFLHWRGAQGFGEYDFSSSENLRAEGLCLLPTPGVSSQLWRAVPLPHSPGPAWNSSPRQPTPSNQDFQVCDSFPFSSGRAWIQRADYGVRKHPHSCHSWISIQQLCLCSPPSESSEVSISEI